MGSKPKVSQKSKCKFLDQFNPDLDSPARKTAISLLQMMIQTNTVNPPGNENQLAEKLQKWVKEQGFDFVKTTNLGKTPVRANLIIEIPGTDPHNNPSWGFMSHIDVVPIEGNWEHQPFSGELVQSEHDLFIWGRGAIDTKALGAAHLTAAFTALKEGWRPKGNIKILLCADEEQGGHEGMQWLVENHLDLIKCDCTLNEGGGFKLPLKNDFVIQIGEKGTFWTKLKIKGKAGHGSSPPDYNITSIFKTIKILNKIKNRKRNLVFGKEYLETVAKVSIPGVVKGILKNKVLFKVMMALADKFTSLNVGQVFYPLVTDTIAVTNFHSGIKENSLSPNAEIILDIRSLPGRQRDDVNKMIQDIVGDKIWNELEWSGIENNPCTTSGIDNPYYSTIEKTLNEIYPGANIVPILSAGSTDCQYL